VRRSESATEHPTSIVLGDFADDGQLELLVTKRLIQFDRNTFSCDARFLLHRLIPENLISIKVRAPSKPYSSSSGVNIPFTCMPSVRS
jgi:hypothetical protein